MVVTNKQTKIMLYLVLVLVMFCLFDAFSEGTLQTPPSVDASTNCISCSIREETEGDEDLEEGEIADDDEEEPALVDKLTKNDDKKEEAKSNGSSTATAASKTVGVDKSDSKFSSASSASAADSKKREPKRRARKRGSDDEHPDSRDMLVIYNLFKISS